MEKSVVIKNNGAIEEYFPNKSYLVTCLEVEERQRDLVFEAENVKINVNGILECIRLPDDESSEKPAKVFYNGKFYIEEIVE